jgi:hypothetical protein
VARNTRKMDRPVEETSHSASVAMHIDIKAHPSKMEVLDRGRVDGNLALADRVRCRLAMSLR